MSNSPLFGGELPHFAPSSSSASSSSNHRPLSPRSSNNDNLHTQSSSNFGAGNLGGGQFRSSLDAPFSSSNSQQGSPQFGNNSSSFERPQYSPFAQPVDINNLRLDLGGRPNLKSVFKQDNLSEPQTPVDQIPPPLGISSEGYTKHRFGSVSSIATTDDEDMGPNEIIFEWNQEQDDLLKSMYEDLISKPDTTPFTGNVPPSGILHRVSKDTLRMARHRDIYFPHSMNSTRHRLIFLCQDKEPVNYEELEKYSLSRDYFSMAPTTADQEFNGQEVFGEDDFNFSDNMSNMPRKLSIEEKYGMRSQGSGQPQGLAAPFKEPQPNSQTAQHINSGYITEEDIVNIVAKRKRDSLRMKRGPH